jgi:hypothetical protein
MDLLTSYTHDSEVQALKVLPLISTIHKSPQRPLSLFQPAEPSPAVPWQRLLTMEILQLHTLRFDLQSLPCRTLIPTNWVAPIVFKTTLRHGPRRKHSTSIVVKECLPRRRIATMETRKRVYGAVPQKR